MNTFIVLLRGVNVSGKNKIPMAELRSTLNKSGFQEVQTYIQSGNIILKSEESKEAICIKIHEAIKVEFGFEIPVLVSTPEEWEEMFVNYPFSVENEKIVAFTVLDKVPSETHMDITNVKEDQYKIKGNIVYLYCPSGFGKTKLTNATIEKKLKVQATTRNLKTTRKLLELAKEV